MDPTVLTDGLDQYQPPGGTLLLHFRPSARSNDHPNADTMRDSGDLHEVLELGGEAEQAQQQDFEWTADGVATD